MLSRTEVIHQSGTRTQHESISPLLRLSPHHSLLILISVYLLLGVVYVVIVPAFEAPDEREHYGYVQHLVSQRRLPPREEDSWAGHEASQPPLYYAVAALGTGWRQDEAPLRMKPNTFYGNYQAPGTVNDNKNAFLHYDLDRFLWRGVTLTVRLARLVNLLFGTVTVFATYLLAREAFAGQRMLALCAAGVVAFLPQFLFVSSAINNDVAASAFSTLTLWLLVGGLRRGYSLSRVAQVGVVAGLAALSKVSALALLPLSLSVIGLYLWSQSAELRIQRRLRLVLTRCAVVLALALAIAGWWYIRNLLLYQDPLGLDPHLRAWWTYERPLGASRLWSQLPGVGLTFLAAFGMGNIHLPAPFYIFMASLALLAAMGLVAWALQAWRSGEQPGPRAWSLALLAIWSFAIFIALVRWMQLLPAALGRLLFPAIGALAVLLIWGLSQAATQALRLLVETRARRTRLRRFGLTGFVAILLCVAGASPFLVIRPAYARPALLSQEDLAEFAPAPGIEFGNRIRLTGYELTHHSTHPGKDVHVTLCWEALDQMERDYAYFVHLLGANDRILGARNTHPGLGRFPTTLWSPGDAFCDVVRVPVHSETPVPAVYDVEIGWYEPRTGERLAPRGPDAHPMDLVLLDRIKITPETQPTLEVPRPVNASFGDQIELLGYDLSQDEIHVSESLIVTLLWKAETSPAHDYTVFVHLTRGDGTPDAQHDSQPRGGSYPTSFWEMGEVVADQHVLKMPEGMVPGRYQLLTGLYRLQTGERLMHVAEDGTVQSDHVSLGSIDVEPEVD